MNTLGYTTILVDVSAAVAAGQVDGVRVNLVPRGTPVVDLLIRRISPVSQNINIHFGPNADAIPVFQGENFADTAVQTAASSDVYTGGVWWSYNGAPVPGTTLIVTVFTGMNS